MSNRNQFRPTSAWSQRTGYVRLADILAPVGPLPISKSSWWAGVKAGRYPAAVKLGPRITAWKVEDILALMSTEPSKTRWCRDELASHSMGRKAEDRLGRVQATAADVGELRRRHRLLLAGPRHPEERYRAEPGYHPAPVEKAGDAWTGPEGAQADGAGPLVQPDVLPEHDCRGNDQAAICGMVGRRRDWSAAHGAHWVGT